MPGIYRIVLIVFLMCPFTTFAQTYYWIGFTDKNGTPYTTDNPSAYLSERAVQRRAVQNIPIDELDLPVNPEYIVQVLDLGSTFIHSSKWLNGITVKADSTDFEASVISLPFVSEIQITKRDTATIKSVKNKFIELNYEDDLPIDTSYYGSSVYQVGQLNGQYLHNKNYLGQGKQVAVLDAGFYNVQINPAFDSLWANGQILGSRDFVNPGSEFFSEHYHGMSVLSIMGGNIPGELIGTAPEASYWLIRSEDSSSEFIIEEDNWVAAAEFADSVGADIINSSLGYFLFDDSATNHSYADMDGRTTRVTKAANIAVTRGLLVVASAGNEGNDPWKYIIAPSDGDNVIGVGAVNRDGLPAPFTSYGPASDGDVKPNVSAVGWNTTVQRSNGSVAAGSGTSYSGPVIAGMAACLWQAYPEASSFQIKNAIEKSADLFNSPDSLLGYGIPDFMLASQILEQSLADDPGSSDDWFIYPNPFKERLVLFQLTDTFTGEIRFEFFDISGRLLRQQTIPSNPVMVINNLSGLPEGLLILRVHSDSDPLSFKLIKIE